MKRTLTTEEIEYILDFDIHNENEVSLSLSNQIKNDLKKQLNNVEVIPEIIPKLKNTIFKQYKQSIIQPGECIGILTAQCIGEKQTQMMLNTFHFTGMAIKSVISGVPRFTELLNATQNPKGISMYISLKDHPKSIKQARNIIGQELTEITLGTLIQKFTISNQTPNESWFNIFTLIYPERKNILNIQYSLRLHLNRKILYEYKILLEDIVNTIEKEFDNILCSWAPCSNFIDIFVETKDIEFNTDTKSYINKDNYKEIFVEEVVLPSLRKLLICGISNIKQIQFVKSNEQWQIETNGSNLINTLALPFIDPYKTYSTDMWEIYHIFGIEAAYEFLVREFLSVISEDGAFMNRCHITSMVAVMTRSGTITSISRYGMKDHINGCLQKISFEESLDNFISAGFYGQKESTNAISASIICGKVSKTGTGICNILMDVDKLENNRNDFVETTI